jgi:hypothetical protein
MMINNASDELGEFGFGWKSFARVGRAAYGVGRGAYGIASMPVKAALKVANATSGVLCKGGGVSTGSAQDAQTASAFCRAMRAKDQVTVRKLLPRATAVASKAAQVRAAYNAPVNGAGLGDRASFHACVKNYVDELGYSVSDARAACQSEMSGACFGAVPTALWNAASKTKKLSFKSCVKMQMDDMGASRSDAEFACQDELAGADDLADTDVNLLASLYGANPDELAYALSGVDPGEIGAALTKTDMFALAPAAVAVVAGFWMLLRG